MIATIGQNLRVLLLTGYAGEVVVEFVFSIHMSLEGVMQKAKNRVDGILGPP
jgi:hypothetical protein